jgi:hypothetical protein
MKRKIDPIFEEDLKEGRREREIRGSETWREGWKEEGKRKDSLGWSPPPLCELTRQQGV